MGLRAVSFMGVCVTILAGGAVVCADMTAPSWSASGDSDPPLPVPQISRPIEPVGEVDPTGTTGLPETDVPEDTTPVKHLPGSPDSASLFMCAAGMLGISRVARRLNAGALPSWYHTGGPRQIGYAFAIDLDSIGVLPVCHFDAPAGDSRRILCASTTESTCGDRPELIAATRAPRAPPVPSLC